jgi:hypothetical protein
LYTASPAASFEPTATAVSTIAMPSCAFSANGFSVDGWTFIPTVTKNTGARRSATRLDLLLDVFPALGRGQHQAGRERPDDRRQPDRPKADDVRSPNLLGVVWGALAPVSI